MSITQKSYAKIVLKVSIGGSMDKSNRVLIKNSLLIICLIVLLFQFRSSYQELTDLVEVNQPYVSENQDLEIYTLKTDNAGPAYVRVDTLNIYTHKLFQTILLLFGVFMCLMFLSLNNNYSLLELMENKNE